MSNMPHKLSLIMTGIELFQLRIEDYHYIMNDDTNMIQAENRMIQRRKDFSTTNFYSKDMLTEPKFRKLEKERKLKNDKK